MSVTRRHSASYARTTTIKRSKGRSATAGAAYRSGTQITDQRTGERHDYSRKEGVVGSFTVGPEGAENWSHSKLWNAAEKAENRDDAIVAREFVHALPAELTDKEREKLCLGFAKHLHEEYGMALQVSIHAPHKEIIKRGTDDQTSDGSKVIKKDNKNHHCHFLMTTREVSVGKKSEPVFADKKISAKQFNTRYRRHVDEEDVFRRSRTSSVEIKKIRRDWEKRVNSVLKTKGVEERVDLRTHAERDEALGITTPDHEKSKHNGPIQTNILRKQQYSFDRSKAEAIAAGLPILDMPIELQAHKERTALKKQASQISNEIKMVDEVIAQNDFKAIQEEKKRKAKEQRQKEYMAKVKPAEAPTMKTMSKAQKQEQMETKKQQREFEKSMKESKKRRKLIDREDGQADFIRRSEQREEERKLQEQVATENWQESEKAKADAFKENEKKKDAEHFRKMNEER